MDINPPHLRVHYVGGANATRVSGSCISPGNAPVYAVLASALFCCSSSCLWQSANLLSFSAHRFFAAAKRARVHILARVAADGSDVSVDEFAIGLRAGVGA